MAVSVLPALGVPEIVGRATGAGTWVRSTMPAPQVPAAHWSQPAVVLVGNPTIAVLSAASTWSGLNAPSESSSAAAPETAGAAMLVPCFWP